MLINLQEVGPTKSMILWDYCKSIDTQISFRQFSQLPDRVALLGWSEMAEVAVLAINGSVIALAMPKCCPKVVD